MPRIALLPVAVLTAIAPLALTFVLATPVAAPAQDDSAYLGYRHELMEGIGSDMGAISDILKYGLPLTGSIEGHARSMAALAKIVPAAFERKITEGPTDAKAEIWSDPDGFAKASAAFAASTQKLAEVAATKDAKAIGAQVQAVGKTCGGCHKQFRKPKEESYKRDSDDDSSH